jgi:hypothetical protein
VDECFPESFLDNVFGIFPNSCVTERERKNPSLVTLGETFKTQFISILGGGHEFLVRSGIRRRSNASFANLVSKLTQHDASPFQWAGALEPVRLPLFKLRATHSPNPGLRKSLIFGGTSAWKSKKSEKSKMSNRLTFEFAVTVRKSTIRELQASRRELLVQLAHKTYEPAREKAEERG